MTQITPQEMIKLMDQMLAVVNSEADMSQATPEAAKNHRTLQAIRDFIAAHITPITNPDEPQCNIPKHLINGDGND